MNELTLEGCRSLWPKELYVLELLVGYRKERVTSKRVSLYTEMKMSVARQHSNLDQGRDGRELKLASLPVGRHG